MIGPIQSDLSRQGSIMGLPRAWLLEAFDEAVQLDSYVPPEADIPAAALVTVVAWCLVIIP